ncbi:hypothetical protein [Candidatus Spyradosoma sp. SGI.093]|uniref:hypothetical protein n=1 Tax=Candidatus Spyradosoma sp. SGI.093 TaxID=3420583 RepID=UPI003D086552
MKKSTVYTLIAAVLLGALAIYFALEMRAVAAESEQKQAVVEKLRAENREVFTLKERIAALEKLNAESVEDSKKLLEENDSLKNVIAVKDNDLAKMKLFSDDAAKQRLEALEARSRAEAALAEEKARAEKLLAEIEASKLRADELNGEIVRLRELSREADALVAAKNVELEELKGDLAAFEAELAASREIIKELQ